MFLVKRKTRKEGKTQIGTLHVFVLNGKLTSWKVIFLFFIWKKNKISYSWNIIQFQESGPLKDTKFISKIHYPIMNSYKPKKRKR